MVDPVHARAKVAGALPGWLLFWATAFATPSAAVSPDVPTDALTQDEAAPETVYVARTEPDRIGRIMAPVLINGRGPFAFIVDTGASRSVIAPRVVERLGLVPDDENRLSLTGITGTQAVPSILVDTLQVGDLRLEHQRLPVIAPSVFANADGILGVEGLRGLCLYANFVHQSIAITRNGCPVSSRNWARTRARLRFGGLVTVKARVGGHRVFAVIDTGAERSLGNLELLRALNFGAAAEDPRVAADVLGATPERVPGKVLPVPTVYLGEFQVDDLSVTFGDLEVFRLWGLQDEPAIVLGMDVLGNADALIIDYRRAEVRVLPRGSAETLRIDSRALPGRLP